MNGSRGVVRLSRSSECEGRVEKVHADARRATARGSFRCAARTLRMTLHSALLLLVICGARTASAADCLSIDEAPGHIGEMACVTGKVLKVVETRATHILDFCDRYRRCPFSVVIFKRDLKDAKILDQFPGRTIRIYGPIQQYYGRAEIILKLEQQLSGEPGTYADALKPRQKRDRRAPAPGTAGVLPGQ